MDILQEHDTLAIQQIVEDVEVFTPFETKNKYRVLTADGEELFFAQEQGTHFFLMNYLKSRRPFELDVFSSENGAQLLKVERPFRFIFQDAVIYDPKGQRLGSIEGQIKPLQHYFHILNDRKQVIYHLCGPMIRPWTFYIKSGNDTVGKITKKWSGAIKETFTKADNFGIEFPRYASPEMRAVLLGAVFLIDFAYFERSR